MIDPYEKVSPPPPPSPNGDVVTPLLPYGVGIDCHSKFIQVCCLVQQAGEVHRYEREFTTEWKSLQQGAAWALAQVAPADKSVDQRSLRYTIESTGTYHMPVLRAWLGVPSVVNPMLAGPTKRKTDVLDGRMLAHHSLIGLWPSSFIPSQQAECLRVLIGARSEAGRNATRCLNRINNHLLRFGHTFGRDHSMADTYSKAAVEDMIAGRLVDGPGVCPDGIPGDVRIFFADAYAGHDFWSAQRTRYQTLCLQFVRKHLWPTGDVEVKGGELLKRLLSVPGVGEVSALTWLSVVADPRRFQSANQVAAFCGADPSLKVSAGKVTSHIKRKGNARLHHTLKNVAAQLVRRGTEPLGRWGHSIARRHAKGGWARAINAVSRRLAVALWCVHKLNADFSYEQYRFYLVPTVPELPIGEMELGGRFTKMLIDAGCNTSREVAQAFMTSLPQQKGIGAGCLGKVKQWIDQHRQPDQPRTTPAARAKAFLETKPSKVCSSTAASSVVGVKPTRAKRPVKKV